MALPKNRGSAVTQSISVFNFTPNSTRKFPINFFKLELASLDSNLKYTGSRA